MPHLGGVKNFHLLNNTKTGDTLNTNFNEYLDLKKVHTCKLAFLDHQMVQKIPSTYNNDIKLKSTYNLRHFIKVWSKKPFTVDLASRQSLCKALKILETYSFWDAESSWAKAFPQLINLPGARPWVKPLEQCLQEHRKIT